MIGRVIGRAVMTSHSRCAKDSASCDTKREHRNIGCWLKNFVYVVAADLFILYVHEHDRLGFGMLTVETAVLNPQAVFDCIYGLVPVATEKVSSIRSNIIWNQWKSTLKERSVRVNLNQGTEM